MALTYILYSPALDKYYVGHTSDSMEERLRRHLSEHNGHTSKTKDWEVVFIQEFEEKKDAHALERKIKGWKSRKMIEKLLSNA